MPHVPVYIRARSQLPVFARGGIQQYLEVDIGNAFQSLSGITEQHLYIYVKFTCVRVWWIAARSAFAESLLAFVGLQLVR